VDWKAHDTAKRAAMLHFYFIFWFLGITRHPPLSAPGGEYFILPTWQYPDNIND